MFPQVCNANLLPHAVGRTFAAEKKHKLGIAQLAMLQQRFSFAVTFGLWDWNPQWQKFGGKTYSSAPCKFLDWEKGRWIKAKKIRALSPKTF